VAIHAAVAQPIAPRVRGVLAFAPYERLRTPLGARLSLRGMPRSALVPPALATLGMLGVRERSTRDSVALLKAPLAVLAGQADPVTPLAEARDLAASATRARFTSIPNARHDDFHTLGREETVAALAWITHHA
jgi:pimeloyl-ACP methyl ester carboxylesterase